MDEISHLKIFLKDADLDETTLRKYIKKYQETNCPDTFETIINGCMNYMIKMSRTFRQHYTLYSEKELLSCIYMGMERAVNKYDDSKGACFATYALYWFRYYVNEYNLKSSSKVKISQTTHSKVKKLSGLIDRESHLNNEELSDVMGMSVKKVIQLKSIKECMSNYSISNDIYIQNQMELKLFEDAKVDYDPELIVECVKELGDRNKRIIVDRFGLINGDPKTLSEIGDGIGITAERVRQIILETLPKLKKIYKTKLNT